MSIQQNACIPLTLFCILYIEEICVKATHFRVSVTILCQVVIYVEKIKSLCMSINNSRKFVGWTQIRVAPTYFFKSVLFWQHTLIDEIIWENVMICILILESDIKIRSIVSSYCPIIQVEHDNCEARWHGWTELKVIFSHHFRL